VALAKPLYGKAMSKSSSIQSFPHCKNIWDEAVASPTGSILVTVPYMTESDRNTLIGDLFHYRVLVRKENSKFYPPGHPQHMTSIFDPFVVSKAATDNGQLAVRIRKRKADEFQILVEGLNNEEK
jgi:hypothetical protein